MIVTERYSVPRQSYPHYDITARYVQRLNRQCQKLIRDCGLSDCARSFNFGNVHVYVQSEDGKPLLKPNQLPFKKTSEEVIKTRRQVHDWTSEEAEGQDFINPKILVRGAGDSESIPDFPFDIIVSLLPALTAGENPLSDTRGATFTVCSSPDEFAKDISNGLQRYALRLLRPRIVLLQCFTTEKYAPHANSTNACNGISVEKGSSDEYVSMVIEKYLEVGCGRSFSHNCTLAAYRPEEGKHKNHDARENSVTFCDILSPDVLKSVQGRYFSLRKGRNGYVDSVPTADDFSDQTTDEVLGKHLGLVKYPERQQAIKDIIVECQALFRRSNVPSEDMPGPSYFPHGCDKEVVQDIFGKVPEATECGYRFGTFYVFVDENIQGTFDMVQRKVREVLQIHNIQEFVVRRGPKSVTQFRDHSAGCTIHVSNTQRGTLGGFVLKGKQRELCGVTAGHVTEGMSTVRIRCRQTNELVVLGEVLQPLSEDDGPVEERVDIAAVRIAKENVSECSQRYKTSRGEFANSFLLETASRRLLFGTEVHIWGAGSSPGLGKVTMVEVYRRVSGSLPNLVVEDIEDSEHRFAKPGDSGAIVCADRVDGEAVDVISIVLGMKIDRGQNDDRRIGYMTQYMEMGLRQLERQQNGEIFQLA